MLTFICTAVVSYVFVNKIEREHRKESTENTLSSVITNIELDLLEPQSTLNNISQFLKSTILHGNSEEYILKFLNDIEENTINDETRIYRSNGAYGVLEVFGGKFFFSNGKWIPPEGYNPQERPWYKKAVEANGKIGLTSSFQHQRDSITVISFARRVFDEKGNPLFVICMDAPVNKITRYASNIHLTKNSYGVLLNENMEFIVHPNKDMFNKSLHNIEKKLTNDLEHGIEISEHELVNYKGEKSIVFFKTLENGWHLGLVIPKDEYYENSRNMAVFLVILGIVSASILSVILVITLKTREKNMKEIKRKSDISHVLNRAAAILLSDYDEETFETSLLKSFELLGPVFDVDRVQIWHNEMINGELNFVLRYEWLSEYGKKCTKVPNGLHYLYKSKPDWHSKFLRGESINMPISSMSKEDQNFLCRYEMKTIAIIPMFLHSDDFCGFFSIDDCRNERTFSDEEMRVLASAGLMISHAINRNMQTIKIREANEHTKVINHWYKSILNTIPFPITVTDSEAKWTFVNTAVENLLDVKLENVAGKPCSNWNSNICKTSKCGIECLKHGIKQTFFQHKGLSYKVDAEILKDLNGKTTGFVEIVQNITELENMLKRQTEAESMSHAKSLFLARISHEIRTPMNVILGITEIQLRDKELDQKLKGYFTMIYNAVDLLMHIINDILDLSKIEAGKMELSPAKYEVASLISDVIQLNFIYNGSKRIEFELDIDENIPFELIGDEIRIKQILNNLLSNAFKYTETGTIKLSVSVEYGENSDVTLICCISDTGYGMTEEQKSKIFEEYSRFSFAGHSIEGTGLGMSITQNLVKLMHGKIFIESELDKGSVFTVHLPQKSIGTNILGKELVENLQKFRLVNSKQEEKMQIVCEPMPYGSVLVVDDVETNIYVMQGFLAPYELSVDTARSGFEAIGKIKSGKIYDIIFMDHMMPRMDGIEAVRIIRELGYENLIVALTANAILGQAEIFLKNGFDGFISKPIDSRQLNLFLKRYIRDRQPPEVIEKANRRENKIKPEIKFQENSMFEIFAKDAKRIVSEMNAVFKDIKDASEEKLRLFAINAHAMKGTLANIGEIELSHKAFILEKAGKEHDKTTIKANTNEFLDALNKIIAHIETKTKKSEASKDENLVYLQEQLKIVSEASANYDKKAAKSAIKNLEKMSWTKDTKNAIDEISKHLLHGDFEKAKNAASVLLP